jgi:signal transduction histidine kinase/CheY-like chemotaxis protein
VSRAALAGYLRAAREGLIRRWLDAVRGHSSSVPSAQELSETQLRDHLPDLLDEIIRAVEGTPTPEVEAEGRAHGRQRFSDGYDISEVLRELFVLRETLLDVVDEYAFATPGLLLEETSAVKRHLRQVIDRSAQAGVDQFHTEALAARRRLWTELEAANLQLKAANEQKDRFLAMLSHELRNPLAPIFTAVQLLEFSEGTDPRLRRARETIARQVHHQARLIEDLLDLSRVTHGRLSLHREVHDLKEVAAAALEACRAALDEKVHELHVLLPEQPLPVEADPVRLEQVVTNLLLNAIRYTDSGGTIWLSAAQENDVAVVRVRDNGTGIGPELLPRVFELFTQADTARDRPQSGLGIGLALVKTLVELHGGTIAAASAGLGAGSEFVVRLPLVKEAIRTPLAPATAGPTPARRRVAVVEDNTDAREMLAELLELRGYSVVTAADGQAALCLAGPEPPEVLIVDIGLPVIDGYGVARRWRQMPGGEETLLIALTGYGSEDEKEQAREAGFDAHLIKPADIEELEQLLDRWPSQERARAV